MSACEGESREVAEFLIDRGALVDAVNSAGETALMCACRAHYEPAFISIITLLIEHGVDINQTDNKGNTALMR